MKIMLLMGAIALAGCSYVSYQRGDIQVTGIEIGTDKALAGFRYESDSAKVAIDSLDQNQTAGMKQVNQLVSSIVEGAVKGAKP